MSLLATTGMSVTFGGLRAVNGVDLVVEQGSLVGLIGPNGAGKTTFIDGITGFVPNDETDDLRWVTPDEARRLLTYDRDRDVLAAV